MHARYDITTNETIPSLNQVGTRFVKSFPSSWHPADSDIIWSEVIAVRPDIDPNLRSFLDTCITSCNKKDWMPELNMMCGLFQKNTAL